MSPTGAYTWPTNIIFSLLLQDLQHKFASCPCESKDVCQSGFPPTKLLCNERGVLELPAFAFALVCSLGTPSVAMSIFRTEDTRNKVGPRVSPGSWSSRKLVLA